MFSALYNYFYSPKTETDILNDKTITSLTQTTVLSKFDDNESHNLLNKSVSHLIGVIGVRKSNKSPLIMNILDNYYSEYKDDTIIITDKIAYDYHSKMHNFNKVNVYHLSNPSEPTFYVKDKSLVDGIINTLINKRIENPELIKTKKIIVFDTDIICLCNFNTPKSLLKLMNLYKNLNITIIVKSQCISNHYKPFDSYHSTLYDFYFIHQKNYKRPFDSELYNVLLKDKNIIINDSDENTNHILFDSITKINDLYNLHISDSNSEFLVYKQNNNSDNKNKIYSYNKFVVTKKT